MTLTPSSGVTTLAPWHEVGLSLVQPRRLVQPSPWVGHLPFAQWLVGVHRPRLLVELGVHTGNSYCSFCEAIDRLGLETSAFGVDHWLGDPQAGDYGNDVYEELKNYHDPLYGRFSTLLRMDFAAAATTLRDGSVDLLHIDGLHTYEAVRDDFETFERKLSARGLVLFHDTNVRAPDFGVWRFFGELSQCFPSVEFLHSNGLGLVYVGSAPPAPGLAALLAANHEEESLGKARAYFARLGATMNDSLQLEALCRRLASLSGVLDRAILDRDLTLAQAKDVGEQIEENRTRLSVIKGTLGQRVLEAEEPARYWLALHHILWQLFGVDAAAVLQSLERLGGVSSESNARDRYALHQLLLQLLSGAPLRPEAGVMHRIARRVARKLRILPAAPPLPGPLTSMITPPEPDAEARNAIRASRLFEETSYAGYAEAKAIGIDPLAHYLAIGETRGERPGPDFNPHFYARRYPDTAGVGALRHYVLYGKSEGRLALSREERLQLPLREQSGSALLILADGGEAPALSHSVARAEALVNNKCGPLIVLARREGPSTKALRGLVDEVIILPADEHWVDLEADAIALRIRDSRTLRAVILLDYALAEFVPAFAALDIPVVAAIDDAVVEDCQTAVYHILKSAHSVIAASETTRNGLPDYFGALAQRKIMFTQPPVTPLPEREPFGSNDETDITLAICKEGREAHLAAVIGGESDIALLWALAAALPQTAKPIRLAWLGPEAAFKASAMPKWLAQANAPVINRSLVDRAEIVARLADSFILLPQAGELAQLGWKAIASARPVVTMQAGGSLLSWLSANPASRHCVIAPYEVVGAAAALAEIVSQDGQPNERCAAMARTVLAEAGPVEAACRLAAAVSEAQAVCRQVAEDVSLMVTALGADAVQILGPTDVDPTATLRNNAHVWAVAGTAAGVEQHLRRPVAGFNPLIYRRSHAGLYGDPCARWLSQGRPDGEWTHPCLTLRAGAGRAAAKVAIHGHFHYPDLLPDFLRRLSRNETPADLFLTTTGDSEAALLREASEIYRSGTVDVRVVPNRGRDIGPFINNAMPRLADYDVVLHIHGKKSNHIGKQYGETWRNFLWSNLIGDEKLNALDAIISIFLADPKLGLAFPEDPYLSTWGANLELAGNLAERMGISGPLPAFPEFPVGNMFVVRPTALQPILDLGLKWSDYPNEPLPVDGTILHTLERLLPLAVQRAGFNFTAVHRPDSMR